MDRNAAAILDELLAAEARAGSATAFAQLVERWTPRLRRHAERLLLDRDAAADAVQDAWLSIAKGIRGMTDPVRFAPWAYSITSRRCVDTIRRRVRVRRLEAEVSRQTAELDAPSTPPIDEHMDLAAAIGRLPIDQRMMVSLFYGEGLSVDDIAKAHGIPAGTIKSRLHAARRTLKANLEGDGT